MTKARAFLFLLVAACALVVCVPDAQAQCALCKTAISGSPSAAKLAQNLNFAIIVLLIPPVLMFCGIFLAAFRSRKAQAPAAEEGERGKGRGRATA